VVSAPRHWHIYQFQHFGGFRGILESNGFIGGDLIHDMAESGNTAVLAGDDFASGFYQFRFAAPSSS